MSSRIHIWLSLVLTLVVSSAASAQCYEQRLLASDGNGVDSFGTSVAISGGVAISGAWLDGGGSAYLLAFNGTRWVEAQKLTTPDAASFFGTDVAIDGDHAVVAAQSEVFFYEFNGTMWVENGKFILPDPDTIFPAVAIEGDVAIVGSYWDDAVATDGGAAYVLRFNDTTWIAEETLAPATLRSRDFFGAAVDIDGGRLLVGAYGDGPSTPGSGAAYTFVHDGAQWNLEDKLDVPDDTIQDLGLSAAIDGNLVVLGAPSSAMGLGFEGAAVAFEFDAGQWRPREKLLADPPVRSEYFGSSLAMKDGRLIVGARGRSGGSFDLGSAYHFQHDGAAWELVERLHPLGAHPSDFIGDCGIGDRHIIIGNEGFTDIRNGTALGVGAVHFFDQDCQPCLDLTVSNFEVGETATFHVTGGTANATVIVVAGRVSGITNLDNFNGYCALLGIKDLQAASLIGGSEHQFDADGSLTVDVIVPPGNEGRTFFFQAAEQGTCPDACASNVLMKTLPQ